MIETVEAGYMTKDLAILSTGRWDVKVDKDYQVTEEFMDRIDDKFQEKWKALGFL